jgi:hypothetical protein
MKGKRGEIMNLTVKSLLGFKIQAEDGHIGSPHDVFFDDDQWCVRYIIVDTGLIFGRKVLIPPAVVHVDEGSKELKVDLTKDQIKDSPDVSIDPPLSRDQEIEYHDYFRWPYYWGGGGAMSGMGIGVAPEAMVVGDTNVSPNPHPQSPEDKDFHLRSVRDIFDYELLRDDQKVGEIVDFTIEISGDRWEVPVACIRLEDEDNTVLVPSKLLRLGYPEKVALLDVAADRLHGAPTYEANRDARYRSMVDEYYANRV